MHYPTEVVNGRAYIKVEGNLDTEQAGKDLRDAFDRVFSAGPKTVVFDLTSVQLINSYVIGRLLMCYRQVKDQDGVLVVRVPEGPVRETFDLLMLDRLIEAEG